MPQHDHISMALFCDFENVALGVRDANYEKFDIKRVLERLLLKGSIVVKKAYCDWDRYKGFKAAMHEANFEMIEIPHVRQSGKNSADIRLVVDALDLCYTKSHVNTFVIISGDSDFSPLVSKLRENAKHVIGVGVKQSTSDLLIANCDEFIYYDDLVRGTARRQGTGTSGGRDGNGTARRSPEEEKRRREEMDTRRAKAVEMAAETYEALVTDRDDGGRIWASVLKEAIKRRNPGFNENYYGFRTFGNLLEEALARGLLEFGRDEKSGTWVARGSGVPNAVARDGSDTSGQAGAHQHDVDTDLHDEVPADSRESLEFNRNSGPAGDSAARESAPAPDDEAQDGGSADESRGRRRSRGGRGRNKGDVRGEGRSEGRSQARPAAEPRHREAPAPAPAPATATHTAPADVPPATRLVTDAAPVPAGKKAARKTSSRGSSSRKEATGSAGPAEAAGAVEAAAKAPARKTAKAPARKTAKAKPARADSEAN
jgi:uncharacterized LabA/DUF88 family protein